MGDGFLVGVLVGVGGRVLSFAVLMEGGVMIVWSGFVIDCSPIVLGLVSVSEAECLFASIGSGCTASFVRVIESVFFSAVR